MASGDVVRPRRPAASLGDMARSLGLMAVVIAALLFLGPARSLLFPGADRMQPVDYSHAAHKFTAVTGASAIVPATSPHGWRATSSWLSARTAAAVRLHIGWATPGSRFAGLDEATGDPSVLLRAVLGARGTTVTGSVQVGAATWQRRVSARGEEALTRQVGRVTVAVTGNATDAQLRTLVESLR